MFELLDSFGGFVLVVVIFVAIMLIRTARIHRRYSLQTDQRVCFTCGESHPVAAQFCRRCGKKLA